MTSALLLGALLATPAFSQTTDTAAPTDTGGTAPVDTGTDPALDLDTDGDGWTPREGDCDDADPQESPGLVEVCDDRRDNDCNGLYDEGCDRSAAMATIRGGGGCTGGEGPAGTGAAAAGLLLLPLAWFARRGRA